MAIEYLYKCVKCSKIVPVIKSLNDATREEHCPFCKLPMRRLYTPPILMGLPNLPQDQINKEIK